MHLKKCPEILFVEDNPAEINLIEHCFANDTTIKLRIIKNGQLALDYLFKRGEYFNAVKPDVIVLDLNLDTKTGQQILAEIKSDEILRTIPVIIFSSSKDLNDISYCEKLKVMKYLIKPGSIDEYYEIMDSIKTMALTFSDKIS